jgi:excisionase family DNA binding protein
MTHEFEQPLLQACQLIASMNQIGGGAGGGEGGYQVIFDIKIACKYLAIGETKFRELVKSGAIPKPFNMGGCLRWHRTDLDGYIEDLIANRADTTRVGGKKRRTPKSLFKE